MKKNVFLFVLAIVAGIFILPAISLATTFDPPAPVFVSGDASGKIFLKSDSPAALDMITGAIQFHNDIMKGKGWGMTLNAFRPAERVNPNLMMIQLYEGTLRTQFSFNIKSGALWGLIPSCNLIPDPKSVIIEYSGPSRDSEDGNGGHHFSLITGLEDSSWVKPVPFNPEPCFGAKVSAAPAPVVSAPVIVPTTQPAPVATVTKKPSSAVKECDPCVVAVKNDTKAIRKSVGDVDPAEPVDEQTLQSKAKKNLQISREVKTAVGEGKADEKGKALSVHDKLGEPTKEGTTVVGLLEKIDKQTISPPPKSLLDKAEELWWLWLILGLCGLYYLFRNRQRPLPPPANP